jgi:hypothetical protein
MSDRNLTIIVLNKNTGCISSVNLTLSKDSKQMSRIMHILHFTQNTNY